MPIVITIQEIDQAAAFIQNEQRSGNAEVAMSCDMLLAVLRLARVGARQAGR